MIRFVLIGCGNIGRRHAALCAMKGKLAAVCDIDLEKARALALEFGAVPYEDAKTLLEYEEDVDVGVICTPNGLHAKHTILCLNARLHVICEKPMAIHSTDAADMVKAASEAKKELFIVKQNRFNPPVMALKKILEENRLGDLVSVQLNCFWNRDASYYKGSSWRGTLGLDGGTLYTQFSHFIDLLYWLFGDLQEVFALTVNKAHKGLIAFEDAGVVALRLKGNILCSIHFTINSFRKNMEGSITVFGKNGTIKIGGEYLDRIEYHTIDKYDIGQLEQSREANTYRGYQGSMSNHDKFYEHVADVLSGKIPNGFNGIDGLKIVEIIERIYNSARQINC